MGKFEKPRTQKPKQPKPTAAQKKQAAGNAGKRGGRGAKTTVLVVLAVLAALVIGFVGYAVAIHKTGDIFPNVYVAGVNVGGMSREEAAGAVQQAVDQTYGTSTLTVKLPDRTLSFEPADTKVSLDVAAAVEKAWRYGRDQGIFKTLSLRLSASAEEHFINIEECLTLDEDYIRSAIDQVAAEVQSDRRDSTFEVAADKSSVTIQVGSSQRSLDADALYEAVITAFMNNDFSALSASYDETVYTPVDLDALYDELCTNMADAYYDAEKKEIVEEVEGYGFDLAAAKQQQAMAAEGSTLTLTLQEIDPEVTKASLEEKLFHDVLGGNSSKHTWNPSRTNNLDLACKAIDGTILNPGDIFSFNEIVGERTAAKGYQAATVFVSGDSKPELGGGVCQVASTIYYSALLADLNIVERLEHMFTVDYVPMGMDATIYWGSNVDFKFENSTSYPIRVDASVSDGYVHIALVGTRETDTTVELKYEVISTAGWKDVEKVDETKPADYKEVTQSPYTGYKTITYKRYLDADKNPISEWEKVQFPNSTYQKRDRVTTIGKQPETPADPAVPTTPEDPATPTDPAVPTTPTDPGTTDPGTTDPGTADPGTTDPGATDPGTTDPGTTDPGNGSEILE